ncbi:MAG TPA: BrnT family toxin [Xanthobacteraceae bacterium]|nr:BrnT family toxin [Xanthobacteraceae bacterium]
MRVDFDWDPAKAVSNAAKHGVTFAEAMTIFGDPLSASIPDDDGAGDERWVTLGQTSSGNLLLVVHTWVDIDADRSAVRIISARRPTRSEARQYRESRMP